MYDLIGREKADFEPICYENTKINHSCVVFWVI